MAILRKDPISHTFKSSKNAAKLRPQQVKGSKPSGNYNFPRRSGK